VWPVWAAVLLLALTALESRDFFSSVAASPFHFAARHVLRQGPPALSTNWRLTEAVGHSVIDANRAPDGSLPSIWSTYSGEIEASYGVVNPSFDYMIDAVGHENRDAYLTAFRRVRPTVVQTVKPSATIFEEWLEDTNWDFYHELLLNYRVAGEGPWSLFWERLRTPVAAETLLTRWDATPRTPRVRSSHPGIAFSGFSATGSGVMEVEVDYEISNPWSGVPLIAGLPRFLIEVRGGMNVLPIPLAPYRTTTRFPVVVDRHRSVSFHPVVVSLVPGAALEIRSIRIHQIQITSDTELWLQNYTAAYHATPARR
jgi:hypothetical protein